MNLWWLGHSNSFLDFSHFLTPLTHLIVKFFPLNVWTFWRIFLVPINESLSCLQSRASSLSETQHSASAPCQRAVCQCACESQITLWWRVPVVIVVCTLHLPSNTYEDLLKERAEQREPALTWQATMATGKEAGRTEAGGRRSRGWWELLWPASGGHNAQVELAVIIWLLGRTNNDGTALAACLPF